MLQQRECVLQRLLYSARSNCCGPASRSPSLCAEAVPCCLTLRCLAAHLHEQQRPTALAAGTAAPRLSALAGQPTPLARSGENLIYVLTRLAYTFRSGERHVLHHCLRVASVL